MTDCYMKPNSPTNLIIYHALKGTTGTITVCTGEAGLYRNSSKRPKAGVEPRFGFGHAEKQTHR